MRISTKIALGFSALLVFAGLSLGYSLHLMRQMTDLTAEVSVDFDASALSRNLLEDLSLLQTVSRVHQTLADQESARRLGELAVSIGRVLDQLQALPLPLISETAVKELTSDWEDIRQAMELWRDSASGPPKQIPSRVDMGIEALREEAGQLTALTRQQLLDKVERSRKISDHAFSFAFLAVGCALAGAVVSTIFLVRSINRPLRALVSGTRAVAGEEYSVRVGEAGDDELSELGRNFNAMVRRLGELDRMKRDFVSYVSHDLKGPLASIVETTSLLSEEIPGPLNEKQRRLLELTQRCAGRLSKMIANLLEFSTLEAGVKDFHFEQVQLEGLAGEIMDEVEPVASESSVSLDRVFSDSLPTVTCDRDGIAQVIRNLLDNAVRFSSRGGTVRVRLNVSDSAPSVAGLNDREGSTSGEFVLIEVSDSGPGISDGDKGKVFNKFFRVERREQGTNRGIGLGLAICQTVVRAHSGALWVEDNPSGGSRFKVLLPVEQTRKSSWNS